MIRTSIFVTFIAVTFAVVTLATATPSIGAPLTSSPPAFNCPTSAAPGSTITASATGGENLRIVFRNGAGETVYDSDDDPKATPVQQPDGTMKLTVKVKIPTDASGETWSGTASDQGGSVSQDVTVL